MTQAPAAAAAATDRQNLEMQDKPDGCLSPADEEREPCLKADAAAVKAAERNNGVAAAPAAAPDARPANNSNGKFHAFAAATSLEQKLRDKTGFSRTGLAVAAVALLLCVVLLVALIVMLAMWPRPPRPFPVCRRASCLRASAEVSHYKYHIVFCFTVANL